MKTSIYSPFIINQNEIKNRLIVAPMTRVSAEPDGTINQQIKQYYLQYAKGGFGAIISEGLYTDHQFSQCYYKQPGITTANQVKQWRELLIQMKPFGCKMIAQLMHAGALSQFNSFTTETVSASAVKPKGKQMEFYYGKGEYALPNELTLPQIEQIKQGYVDSALRAQQAGFTGVEIHAANGYLLDQFHTEYTNLRTDQYGGSTANRVRLTSQIIKAIKAVVDLHFVVGMRISQIKVNDNNYRWSAGQQDAMIIANAIQDAGADYIHTSSIDCFDKELDNKISLAHLLRQTVDIPVVVNGGLAEPQRIESALDTTGANALSIGKAALANPNLAKKIANNKPLTHFDFAMFNPIANLDSQTVYLSHQPQVESD